MKTNKTKYQELIQSLFGFGPPSWARLQSVAIVLDCYKLYYSINEEHFESLSEVFLFVSSLLSDICVPP